jgi:biopolymer transport protein ExbD
MTFKTRCQISKGLVDAAPLVNVVFLLLLFFILNSQFVMQTGVSVILPSSGEYPVVSSFQSLVITVTGDDLLFFRDQLVPMDKLEQTLREAVQQGLGHELIIRAGSKVSIGTEVEIMSAANRAGITTVNMAARPGGPAVGASN